MTDPIVLPKIRRKVLGDQLEARLRAMPGAPVVTVYRGEVPEESDRKPPLLPGVDGRPDNAGRVGPYLVLFDGTGSTDLEPSLAGRNEDLRWSPQITVAAGWSQDCVQLVDRVCAWVYRWQPVITGVAAGWLEPPSGFDPGPPRPDREVSPPRFFVPLQWQLELTT